ncbi:protein translocase subunit SecD [Limnothrix sp. FACHB-881]|uniref:protein translocase subunit SecD n=1 Tax=Limnothrix sp. FACHB-881 TaxID=2692819 RepID=UPI0016855129|nr:protein translocase subunit SecD [Limnothrix sp. FACHB-881]MBD2636067.1 protein translocase subunit SecD [Limnothrix sp. FACHB-881]
MQRQKFTLGFIVVLTIAAIAVIVNLPVQLGLDLRGGSQLTLQVMTTPEIPQVTPEDLSAVRKVIDNRINELGVSEALVQTSGNDKLVVQLPGVSDPEQAERVLGNTARLEFREQKPGTEAQYQAERQVYDELKAKRAALIQAGDKAAIDENQRAIERSQEAISQLFEKAVLTGQDLREAGAAPDGGLGNSWVVIIRFSADAADRYAELTKKLAGTGRGLGIFLDRDLLTAPVVGPEYAQLGITGGSTEIRGNFTADSSQELVIQLKGGALPLPVKLVETRTVGATLGRDSVESSIWAGVGGLVLVLIFMAIYYRLPGVVADLALIIYALLNFAVFALVPVTLSLPGIAGFILSIGMAVDANVLIFERTREELQAGKSLYRSVESGFYRAFSSILDGNVTTLIACVVLFWLGTGLVKGFALTLAIGVLLSMFTALTCSRTLLFVALSIPSLRRPEWYCPGLKAANLKTAGSGN